MRSRRILIDLDRSRATQRPNRSSCWACTFNDLGPRATRYPEFRAPSFYALGPVMASFRPPADVAISDKSFAPVMVVQTSSTPAAAKQKVRSVRA